MATMAQTMVHTFPRNTAVDQSTPRGRTRARQESLSKKDAILVEEKQSPLPRAASYTYIPNARNQRFASPVPLVEIHQLEIDLSEISTPESSGVNTPDEGLVLNISPIQARDIAAKLQSVPNGRRSRIDHSRDDTRSSIGSSTKLSRTSFDSTHTVSTAATTPISNQNRHSFSKSLTKRLNRHSWYQNQNGLATPSRSPSPQKETDRAPVMVLPEPLVPPPVVDASVVVAQAAPPSRRRSFLLGRTRSKSIERKLKKPDANVCELQPPAQAVTRTADALRKRTRPVTGMFKFSSSDNVQPQAQRTPSVHVPSVPLLPKSFSTDKLPILRSVAEPVDRAAPLPRIVASERSLANPLSAGTKRKDELWSVFRTLDGDFAKFSSKSTSLKANVVRASLMPFLRTYAKHPSSRNLRPEDLDRRANILNKWWTGLLEMLHGRNNQSISGTDRPVILDGILGIMERPEWRLAPSPFCGSNRRPYGTSTPYSQSTTSVNSSSNAEFLSESVHLNVRNIFVQNLSSQMAFVVDKMSLRNASASLVTFCGKACAYAFIFVPGMADVLSRLWETPMDTIRRVLDENGIGKFDRISEADSLAIAAQFPPAMHKLGFTSLMKYMRMLRTPPPLPLGTTGIHWWGRWLERWTGRESDLFYVFVKQFHILVTDFLADDATPRERVCVPGLLLVHAQILTNLDSTLHRDARGPVPDVPGSTPPTFDDVLADPDAQAMLPLPPTNAIRIMAENRLIMLIRDFLSERTSEHPAARELFASSFNSLLQSAARGISVFDHAACYTLLDFLEEALVILVRFESLRADGATILNSAFWQSVCRRMISSENTMTEIRLYAFLYTVWNTVVVDRERRRNLCLNLLLDPELFHSRFNHWCPMVRAYYMRLLCWRVGRFDGEEYQPDHLEILETLLERLRTTWASYLRLRDAAAQSAMSLPATNPSYPAPGRRLLIIRTDAAPASSFLSYDGHASPPPAKPSLPSTNSWRRLSSASLFDQDSRPASPQSEMDADMDFSGSAEKTLGGFFRKMMGSSRPQISRSATSTPVPNFSTPFRSSSSASVGRPPASEPLPFQSLPAHEILQPHRNYSFKFSLEFVGPPQGAMGKHGGPPLNLHHHNHHHHRHPPPQPAPHMRLFPPRLPPPAHIYLQENTSRSDLLITQSSASSAHASSSSSVDGTSGRSTLDTYEKYCGRALAEWHCVVGECANFFERRRHEGVPSTRAVETPTLGVEVFRRTPA